MVFAGRFADEFLALPREVLITVMQHHQKYFAVEDAHHTLLPAFLAVRNGDARGLAIVREGNEWVLRARLADARFFFEDDRKRRSRTASPALQDLVFLEQLGTMAEKTTRLEELARTLGPACSGFDRAAVELLDARRAPQQGGPGHPDGARAAGAAGDHGRHLRPARRGARAPVADAIREQYLPRGTDAARIRRRRVTLALLDKLDTLARGAVGGHRADRVPGSVRPQACGERDRRDRACDTKSG